MKKSVCILLPFCFLSVFILLTACSKDKADNNPTAGMTKISEGYAAGAATKVEIYSKQSHVNTGYNKFYIALYDSASGNRVEEAHIHLTPVMDMGMMQHNAPFENPVSETASGHLFPCSVTFVMPSGSGNWTLEIEVHNHVTDKEGSLVLPVTVTDPAKSRQQSFTAMHNGAKYFISLIEPSSPRVGINDLELAIYKKEAMDSWPADSSLTVTMIPEMPSMGHSSPNNVNPVHTGNGHYKGKVNFTMTGLWRLNLDFMSGSAVADTTRFFDVEF
ncbi:MAG: FixH family protein [Sphingobacteriales bacterium]|nr:FixH family protein [Sphingobacteriales bacterium]